MDYAQILDSFKSVIVEGIGIVSLVLAGVALVLIEIWGIKKIWHVMNGRPKPSPRKRIRKPSTHVA